MIPPSPTIGWTALVLAGARGSRLGDDDMAAITIGGTSTLDQLLCSLPERVPARVAGPERPTQRPVTFRWESPIHGGPVAGIAAGLEAVTTPVTALLAVDMPWAGGLVEHLISEFESCDVAALVPVDRSGFGRPLCTLVRAEAARTSIGRARRPPRSVYTGSDLTDRRSRAPPWRGRDGMGPGHPHPGRPAQGPISAGPVQGGGTFTRNRLVHYQ